MKIRFYPKKEQVMFVLTGRHDEAIRDIESLVKELARYGVQSALYTGIDTGDIRRNLQLRRAERDEIELMMQLVKSHGPEEVMMEIDL